MSKEFILKKNIFGGFDRRQVISYLAQLQSQCADSDVHSEIEATRKKIQNLLDSIEEKDRNIAQLKERLETLNSLSDEQYSADGFSSIREADRIVSQARKEADGYIRNATRIAAENNDKFAQMMSRLTNLNEEISLIGTNADRISENINKAIPEESVNAVAEDNNNKKAVENDEKKASEPKKENNKSASNSKKKSSKKSTSGKATTKKQPSDLPSDNSIDNFFNELEKLTGIPASDDNLQELDPSLQMLIEEYNTQADEAFDNALKGVLHSEN